MKSFVHEPLELRRLLAFTADIEDRTLVVECDDDRQRIVLIYGCLVDDGEVVGLHSVAVVDERASGVAPVEFAGAAFDAIRISLGGGDDYFESNFLYVEDGLVAERPAGPFDPEALPRRPLTVDGGDGDDALDGSPLRETLLGGAGDDWIQTGGNADRIDAGADNDEVYVQRADGVIADPIVVPADVVVTILGGAGADSIQATGRSENDPVDSPAMRVDAGDGDDEVRGSNFADYVRAGPGDDYVTGGSGNDSLYGDAGRDVLVGNAGGNRLYGGDDADRLSGSNGRDFLYGEAGDDRLYGNGGNDHLDGGGNKDRVYGGDGDDSIIGGASVDRLYGEAGNDSFIGGPGNDYLFGGAGVDVSRVPDAGDILDSIESAG